MYHHSNVSIPAYTGCGLEGRPYDPQIHNQRCPTYTQHSQEPFNSACSQEPLIGREPKHSHYSPRSTCTQHSQDSGSRLTPLAPQATWGPITQLTQSLDGISAMLKPKLPKPHPRPGRPTWWKALLRGPRWPKPRPRPGRPTWWEIENALVVARARLDGLLGDVGERVYGEPAVEGEWVWDGEWRRKDGEWRR